MDKKLIAIAIALSVFYFLLLCLTLRVGHGRDEGFYFHAGEVYSKWFDDFFKNPLKAFKKEKVEKHFSENPEHPAFPKILFGISWRLFGKFHDPEEEPDTRWWYDGGKPPRSILPILRESTAMRLPALIINSFLIFLVFIFTAEIFSIRAGIVSSFLTMFLPHCFWNAHFACFDMPITTMWFLCAWTYYKSENGGIKWVIFCGVAWGLALSTKHNAFFIPPTLLIVWVSSHIKEFKISGENGAFKLSLPSLPLSFFAMIIIGPIIYYILWPKLWHSPIEHLKFYINRHAHHEYYWAYYFGTLYIKPPFPWGFPFVMSAMTIPFPTLVLTSLGFCGMLFNKIAGIYAKLKDKTLIVFPKGVFSLIFWNFFIPFFLIALPSTPIFGGTKHWFPALPFLMVFAGAGFEILMRSFEKFIPLNKISQKFILPSLISLFFIIPAGIGTLNGYENGSTYYNEISGGRWAMGKYKMQREFWGNTAFSALSWLNKNAKEGAKVDFHDTNWDAVIMYLRDGLLRKDIKAVWDMKNADYYLFHIHKEFLDLEYDVQQYYGSAIPVWGVYEDGVPLLHIYENKLKKNDDG